MSAFFDSQSNLRSGWQFAAFIVVLMPVWISTNFALTLFFDAVFGLGNPLHDLALSVLINFISVALSSIFAARIVEHVPLQTFGVGFHEGWARNLTMGFAIAAGLMALLMLGTRILGETHFEWTAPQTAVRRMALTLGILIVAAAFEELLFRGYLMQTLMKAIGPWPSMIAMSCVFGLLHAQNKYASRLSVFNTIVAGLMLSLAYFKTRSLWFPFGIHLGWNVALGMIVGFPLSGLGVESLWTTHVTGSSWLLGGDYGPEGGVLGTLVFAAGAWTVWKFPTGKIYYDDRFYKDSRIG